MSIASKIDECIDLSVDTDNDTAFIRILNMISNSDIYKNDFFNSSFQHNIYHIQRVMLFFQIIAQNEKIEKKDLNLLLLASALHDSGKKKDRQDYEHGVNSASVASNFLSSNIKGLNEEDKKIIQIAIEYHTITEKNGKIALEEMKLLCEKYNIKIANLKRIILISSILKDADALDRMRFETENNLDIKYLKTKTAKSTEVIELAKNINQEFSTIILNSNYDYEDFIENNPQKTLSSARKNYIKKNNGVIKKERRIPTRIVIKLFSEITKKQHNTIKRNDENNKYKNYGRLCIGGTGDMYLCKDEYKKSYIFKPSYKKNSEKFQPYRAEIQVIASKLQRIISPKTFVKCELCEINGKQGTIQPRIEIDEEKTRSISEYYFDNKAIDKEIIKQFMREYVVDFCLCNYDATFRNFIVDNSGNLRGVDKEQCLKYINRENVEDISKLDYFMKENPNGKYGAKPPIYEKIFRDILNGKIDKSVLEELDDAIKIPSTINI